MDHRVEGLTAGADDYVIKPFDQRDLLARVASALRRSQHSLAADPSTKLPGNVVIRRHLQRKLQEDAECSVAYVDLDHFKAYVDFYGFERAGDVIHAVAQILQRAVAKHGGPHDFVGHIGGDDFLLISQPSHVEVVVQNLVESFAAEVPTYYSEQDGARGYITGQDRYGAQRQFPLLSLSVAIVEIRAGCCPAAADVAAFAGHCKQHIKSDRGQGWRRYPYDAKKLVG
jgi:diguanylate cyclase (GGDEF)-like protein